MFQSYKYIRHLGYKDGKHSWEYELTDSDFGTVSGVGVEGGSGVDAGVAVIQEYSKRKLNVAKNLMLSFSWWHKQYPYYSIQQIIDYNKKYNLLFSQYEEDLQKHLLLI